MSADITKTQIANMALSHIKQSPITSFDEQSANARKVRLYYDPSRRAALRACDWRFATVQKTLALLGDQATAADNPTDQSKQDVAPDWAFLYSYPAQCARIRKLFNPLQPGFPDPYLDRTLYDRAHARDGALSKYVIMRSPITNVKSIASNLQNAKAEWTADITDTGEFDDEFTMALSFELGMLLCLPLTGDKELFGIVKGLRDEWIGEAKRLNGDEGTDSAPRMSNYEAARDY